MKQTGVGKIRENINNLKNNVPIRNQLFFTSGSSGGGGGEGLLQYYRALEVGGGKKENQQGLGRPCAMRVWRIKLRNGPL